MATYKANIDTVAESMVYTVAERNIYGSDRLGMYTYADTVYPLPPAPTADFLPVWRGFRKYELKNHLGNVMTVVTGNKIPQDENNDEVIDGYTAQIEAAYDYSPFGVTRKSFEPNYTPGSSGEANPLAPHYRWCFDGDGIEANGSGLDATLHNMTPTTDRNNQAGSALESQGNTNSYMEIQHDPGLVFGGDDFTVAIWVKRLALNSNWNHTIAAGKWHSGQQASQNEWYLAISNGGSGNNPPQFAIQAGSTKYTAAGTALPVGSWYHLVGVREGDYIKLYVDGSLVDSEYVGAAVINTVPTRNILLARMGNGKFLKAGFDEFVIYHRALSATEVGDLYDLGCGDFEDQDGELASGGYRYSFGGYEKDDEVAGSGNHLSFGDYGYSPRLGRRWNIDPVVKHHASSYATFANNPIWFAEINGLDTLVMHRKSTGVEHGVETFLVTFSVIRDGVESRMDDVMYMGGSANCRRLPDSESFRLDYDREMTRHEGDWKNIAIHVNYTYTTSDGRQGDNIFIHPSNNPIMNLGCLVCSETPPVAVPDEDAPTGSDLKFNATKPALERVRQMYEDVNGGADGSNLTGDKFLLKTESVARSSNLEKIEPIGAKPINTNSSP